MIQDNNFPKPYKSSYIKTDDGHDLYYELVGNTNGLPIVFLHGGPGSGFQKSHRDLFDLDKCKVIFFDQRGAGRSRPKRSLKNNSTDYLIAKNMPPINIPLDSRSGQSFVTFCYTS